MLEWLFAFALAPGIADDSSPLLSPSVGLFAAVSEALPSGVVAEGAVSLVDALLLEDVVPVGALDVLLLGCPAPVGLSGVAGSGGGTEVVVEGVTGGVALVSVALSVRLQPATNAADVASATARARAFMESPGFVK